MASFAKIVINGFVFLNWLMAGWAVAQSPAVWYYGRNVGIDFRTNPVSTTFNSNLYTNECSAVLTNQHDSLLFYTDGANIWDDNHSTILNGTGLTGGESSAQGALILPKPGDCDTFYVFTIQDHYSSVKNLSYSAVALSGNGGGGAVVPNQKNVLLQSNVAEAMTAVLHANGRDYWVVVHGLGINSTVFHSFLITPAGISATPINTSIGVPQNSPLTAGNLRANHAGTQIARSIGWGSELELFDFNNLTGSLSNKVTIANGGFYGLEFSPNDSILYFGTFNNLYQRQLSGTTNQLIASSSANYSMGALALDPAGRILVARDLYTGIYAVQNPNVLGTGCNFGQVLTCATGSYSRVGLPNFAHFRTHLPSDLLSDTLVVCAFPEQLSLPIAAGYEYLWSTGDTTSYTTASATGYYYVTATRGCEVIQDSVYVQQLSSPNLGADTNVCSSLVLYSSIPSGVTATWSDGSSADSLLISGPGTYWLQWDVSGCTALDSIDISYSPLATVNLPDDTTLCSNQTLLLSAAQDSSFHYTWNTGDTLSSILASTAGLFIVNVTGQCNTIADSIFIATINPVIPNLGPDTILCPQNYTLADSIGTGYTWYWSDGSVDDSLSVSTPGTYWVTISSVCGTVSDTITINFFPEPLVDLGPDSAICLFDSLQLITQFDPSYQYIWSTGDTTNFATCYPGTSVWVVVNGNCSSDTDSINVFSVPAFNFDLGPDTTVCSGTLLNPAVSPTMNGLSYSWSGGSTDTAILVNSSGLYFLTVSSPCNVVSDSVFLTVPQTGNYNGPADTMACVGQSVLLSAESPPGYSIYWSTGHTTDTVMVQPGAYSILLVSMCDTISDTVTVSSVLPPEIELGADTAICEHNFPFTINPVVFSGNLQWSDGSAGNSLLAAGPQVFWATATNVCGMKRDSFSITAIEPLQTDIYLTEGQCNAILHSNYSGLWSTGQTGNEITVTAPGKYFVTINNECYQIIDSLDYTPENVSEPIVPNVFTPNGDGDNDSFVIPLSEYQILIYNRWGNELVNKRFESGMGWDGFSGGSPVPEGTYYYMLKYTDECSSEIKSKSGFLSVFR